MVLIDFGSFLRLLNYLPLIKRCKKHAILTIFGQKARTIAHGFFDFGSFSRLLNYLPLIKRCKKHAFLTIIGQKAWTIAQGFDRF
jgi:hypothetical protein